MLLQTLFIETYAIVPLLSHESYALAMNHSYSNTI
jgi:hypothetical protein